MTPRNTPTLLSDEDDEQYLKCLDNKERKLEKIRNNTRLAHIYMRTQWPHSHCFSISIHYRSMVTLSKLRHSRSPSHPAGNNLLPRLFFNPGNYVSHILLTDPGGKEWTECKQWISLPGIYDRTDACLLFFPPYEHFTTTSSCLQKQRLNVFNFKSIRLRVKLTLNGRRCDETTS